MSGRVTGREAVGGVVGYNTGGVRHVSVDAEVSGSRMVGGVVGHNARVSGDERQYRGELTDFVVDGDVAGSDVVGGSSGSPRGR